jgi:hypothetical protein
MMNLTKEILDGQCNFLPVYQCLILFSLVCMNVITITTLYHRDADLSTLLVNLIYFRPITPEAMRSVTYGEIDEASLRRSRL